MNVLELNICGGGPMSLMKGIVSHSLGDVNYEIVSFCKFDNPLDVYFFKNYDIDIHFIITQCNPIKKNIIRCISLRKLIYKNRYDCIHIHHESSCILFLFGLVAKLSGVEKIVFHSHSTGIEDGTSKLNVIKHKMFRPFLRYIGTDFCTCSVPASKWMYPNLPLSKVKLIKNGVDLDLFSINNNVRREYRKKIGISNEALLIGHVGRFDKNKNQEFILKLLSKLYELDKGYKLLLIGDGKTKDFVEEKAKEMNLSENVFFTGNVSNVQDYMQAMDIFVLPSKFEGLGMVAIEAQACGLPVIASTGVPTEAKLTDNFRFISTDNMEEWVKSVEEMITLPKQDNTQLIKNAGYDICKTVETIVDVYSKAIT